MKEYYVICYYDPQNGYSTDPIFYPSEEEARKHARKDVYSMIKCQEYGNEDLLLQIFKTLCHNTDCKKCCYYDNCFAKNPWIFGAENEQQKLKICATLARQFEEGKYE